MEGSLHLVLVGGDREAWLPIYKGNWLGWILLEEYNS
jgi:hypothetical protein